MRRKVARGEKLLQQWAVRREERSPPELETVKSAKRWLLGLASTSRGAEVMIYDQRLFNQEKGIDSRFATANNLYDKGLFTTQCTLSTVYRPKKDVDSDT